MYAATIDLDDHKGNVRDGIHAASCGGVWQAVVFGFCGLELTESGPVLKPNLPSHWHSVRFNVRWRGETLTMEAR
jgi:kojibiose phosphorylase